MYKVCLFLFKKKSMKMDRDDIMMRFLYKRDHLTVVGGLDLKD